MMKYFFIADCLKCNIDSVKELRMFSEKCFELLGYSIDDIGLTFNINNRDYYKSLKYVDNKKEHFDNFDISELLLAQFNYFPKKRDHPSDIECSLDFKKSKTGKSFSITCVFLPTENNISFPLICKYLLKMFESHFTISYFCMDKLENEKRPEHFVHSLLCKKTRNELENTIAHSIQLSHFKHHRMPFLFLYNYFYTGAEVDMLQPECVLDNEKYTYELYFPENLHREFDQYQELPKWREIFNVLSELEILKLGK